MSSAKKEEESSKDQNPQYSRLQKYILISSVWFTCFTMSVNASIRYGFLADSFTKREISGKIYGLTEGSTFFGMFALYLFTASEWLMRRFNAKYMFCGVMITYLTISATTGIIYYTLDDNNIFVPTSILLRISTGTLGYAGPFLATDFIRANFADEFDGVNGLVYMGYYVGHGFAETFGCLLYDHYGYYAPYVLAVSLTAISIVLCAIIVPKTKCYLAHDTGAVSTADDAIAVVKQKRVTWLVAFPLSATMLVSANYGYIQVSLSPYLSADFGKSISYSGVVLSFVSVGMAIGSVVSGILLQKKVFKVCTQMSIGAFLVTLGLFVIFPHPAIKFLYDNVPYLAFVGIFLAGFGDPMMCIAALRAMIRTQEKENSVVTPKQFGFITGLWMMGTTGFYYLGSMIAGILTDLMSFSDAAFVLMTLGMVSIMMCIVSFYTSGSAKSQESSEERKPLLE